MKIRKAKMNDSISLSQFNVAHAWEVEGLALDGNVAHAGVKALLHDANKGFYLLAVIEGRCVGSLMITYEWSDWRNANIWWIQSVYVQPDRRKQGVFEELFFRVEQEAIAAGACALRLYVMHENDIAQSAYQKMGMSAAHYQMFHKSLSTT
ncbi:MAG: GNAT family N-acetyltransferase [Zetaproteobacteria bacterium]|nr:GNAT family N-acetyltransferase [Zetaproteobacteria bacterium]